MFHAKDNWFYDVEKDGSVRFVQKATLIDGYRHLVDVSFDASLWAAIVCNTLPNKEVKRDLDILVRNDFWSLVEEIRTYTKEHPGMITSADLPAQLMLGFVHDDGTYWGIKISKIREGFDKKPEHIKDVEVLRSVFMTIEGRKNFCAMLSNPKEDI